MTSTFASPWIFSANLRSTAATVLGISPVSFPWESCRSSFSDATSTPMTRSYTGLLKLAFMLSPILVNTIWLVRDAGGADQATVRVQNKMRRDPAPVRCQASEGDRSASPRQRSNCRQDHRHRRCQVSSTDAATSTRKTLGLAPFRYPDVERGRPLVFALPKDTCRHAYPSTGRDRHVAKQDRANRGRAIHVRASVGKRLGEEFPQSPS